VLSDASLEVWSVKAGSEELLSMIDVCMHAWMDGCKYVWMDIMVNVALCARAEAAAWEQRRL
jgi:hypothetical protein